MPEPMTDAYFSPTAMPDADWWQALWPDPRSVLDEMGVEVGNDHRRFVLPAMAGFEALTVYAVLDRRRRRSSP